MMATRVSRARGGPREELPARVSASRLPCIALLILVQVVTAAHAETGSRDRDRDYSTYLKDGRVVTGTKPFVGFGIVRLEDERGRVLEFDARLVDLERTRQGWQRRALVEKLNRFPLPGSKLEAVDGLELVGTGLTYVELWPSYCKPCVQTLRDVRKLQDRFPSLQVLSICHYDPDRARSERGFGNRPEQDREKWRGVVERERLHDRPNWRNRYVFGHDGDELRAALIADPRVNNGVLLSPDGIVLASELSFATLSEVERILTAQATKGAEAGHAVSPTKPRH